MSGAGLAGAVSAAVAAEGLVRIATGRRVTVAVPDATRPWEPALTLGPLLDAVAPVAARITVLVGLGLHRPLTDSERAPLEAICEGRARLIEHRADDAMALVTMCTNVEGLARPLPASLHQEVVQADLRILVGVVEPHQYAGFSGGAKAIAIGCAGRATIDALHGIELLRDPGTRLGKIEGNRFAAALWRVAAGLEPMWAVQLVPAESPLVFVGPARRAFTQAVAAAERIQFAPHPRRYAAVRVTVPDAKAHSFYQACRAATYLSEVEPSVLEPGALIVLEAACPEGLGQGAGELAFGAALQRGPDDLHAQWTSDRALPGGTQRALVLARCLERYRLALVGAPPMPVLDAFSVVQAATVAEACARCDPSIEPVDLGDVFRRLPRYEGAK